ncbi:hypothetical protein, partial [Serratia liquefaciens]|uniref:hypothetical protein n=1 Tax=Serratia liquefaciens TaxID=614 RepID=UPI002B054A8B
FTYSGTGNVTPLVLLSLNTSGEAKVITLVPETQDGGGTRVKPATLSPLIGGSLLRHKMGVFPRERKCFMPGIWMTLFPSPKRACSYTRRLNRCMNF